MVHCRRGVSRSSAVVAAYMLSECGDGQAGRRAEGSCAPWAELRPEVRAVLEQIEAKRGIIGPVGGDVGVVVLC